MAIYLARCSSKDAGDFKKSVFYGAVISLWSNKIKDEMDTRPDQGHLKACSYILNKDYKKYESLSGCLYMLSIKLRWHRSRLSVWLGWSEVTSWNGWSEVVSCSETFSCLSVWFVWPDQLIIKSALPTLSMWFVLTIWTKREVCSATSQCGLFWPV